MFATNFLSRDQAESLAREHGTPLYVYSQEALIQQAQVLSSVPAPYGLTIRFAMKANPHPDVLRVFREQGIKIDASSAYEVSRAIEEGYVADDIALTSQQLPENLTDLVKRGVRFDASSLHQLEVFGQQLPGQAVGVRLNPGIGSGHSSKTNVGGVTSSFGIWHEYLPDTLALAARYNLTITHLHTHIGAGTDPVIWQQAADLSLALAEKMPTVTTLNLGGGFKVARMDEEFGADLGQIGSVIAAQLRKFAQKIGRKLHLELEPGTFLMANAGILLSRVEDIVDTGVKGYTFLKLNTGMNDILRTTLYGAQHPIAVLPSKATQVRTREYVVVGHNCESGDLLTPKAGAPETIEPRRLSEAHIGDLVLIGGVGAYCASLAAHGYNSFPSAKEILI